MPLSNVTRASWIATRLTRRTAAYAQTSSTYGATRRICGGKPDTDETRVAQYSVAGRIEASRESRRPRIRYDSGSSTAPLIRRNRMIIDRYAKALLTLIAVALMVIAVRPWLPDSDGVWRPSPAHAQVPPARYEVTIPKAWGKFVGFSNNNVLLEGPNN